MLAFIITALIVGVSVTMFLPFVSDFAKKNATIAGLLDNRLVQILFIGAITVIGIMVFTAIARSLKISPARV